MYYVIGSCLDFSMLEELYEDKFEYTILRDKYKKPFCNDTYLDAFKNIKYYISVYNDIYECLADLNSHSETGSFLMLFVYGNDRRLENIYNLSVIDEDNNFSFSKENIIQFFNDYSTYFEKSLIMEFKLSNKSVGEFFYNILYHSSQYEDKSNDHKRYTIHISDFRIIFIDNLPVYLGFDEIDVSQEIMFNYNEYDYYDFKLYRFTPYKDNEYYNHSRVDNFVNTLDYLNGSITTDDGFIDIEFKDLDMYMDCDKNILYRVLLNFILRNKKVRICIDDIIEVTNEEELNNIFI